MDVLADKIEIINWITSLQDVSVLNALKILKKESGAEISTEIKFSPITKEELIQRALASEEDIKAGRFKDVDSILAEDWDAI